MGGTLGFSTRSNGRYFMEHGDRERALAESAGAYFVKGTTGGEPAPVFMGSGLEPLGLAASMPAGRVHQVMDDTWSKLLHPDTGAALGTPLKNYATPTQNLAKAALKAGLELPATMTPKALEDSPVTYGQVRDLLAGQVTPEELAELERRGRKSQRTNVTIIDGTISGDKSQSVLHVAAEYAGDREMAAVLEDNLYVRARTLVGEMEAMSRTRVGYHGKKVGGVTAGRYRSMRGLAAAVFVHHTNRDMGPHDHAHVAVVNRGLDSADEWHAPDASAYYEARSYLEAVTNRAGEIDLTNRLGVVWEPDVRNPQYRRIKGVDDDLCEQLSSRSKVVRERLRQWRQGFIERNGHEPPRKLEVKAARRIAKNTRKAKVSEARPEMIERVAKELDTTGFSLKKCHRSVQGVISLARYQAQVDEKFHGKDTEAFDYDRDGVVTAALDKLCARQPVWNRHHLWAAIDAEMPVNLPRGMTVERYKAVVWGLVREGLQRKGVVCTVPEQVIDDGVPADLAREQDGLSVFLPRGGEKYVHQVALDTEARVLAAALKGGAPAVSREKAAAIAQEQGLSDDQAAAFTSILSSGRLVDVLIGPAGTGKSHVLEKLEKSWKRAARKRGAVVALTVSQSAAEVLRAEGFDKAMNLARWLKVQERIAAGRPLKSDLEYRIVPGQLFVVDEASMPSSADIATVTGFAEACGGKVLLTGDHRQLGAIELGGALNLLVNDELVRDGGGINELTTVWRFKEDWEKAASLRLRDGDVTVLDDYDQHGGIVTGSPEEVEAELVHDVVTSVLADRPTLAMTDTAEQASALSLRVRQELIELGRVRGPAVALADGTFAATGDMIQVRLNSREIVDAAKTPISNRDVMVITGVGAGGSLDARRCLPDGSQGASVELPASYVRENVQLAYVTTVHAGEGRTVTGLGGYLVDPEHSRSESLYVGLTRSTVANRAYAPHVTDDDGNVVKTGADVLAEVLDKSGAAPAATEMVRDQCEAARSLARVGPVWSHVISGLAEEEFRERIAAVLGPERMALIDADEAAPAFWAQVRKLDADGIDVADALASTLAGREVDSARSIAEVLQWRLEGSRHMAWTPAVKSPGHSGRTPGQDGAVPPYWEGVAAALGPALMEQLEADPAAPAFWMMVRKVDRSGVDVADALRSTLAEREVQITGRSVAQVLHYRLDSFEHMAWPPAKKQGAVDGAGRQEVADYAAVRVAEAVERTYVARSPEPEGIALEMLPDTGHGAYARRLATAMDERVSELGKRAGLRPPEWAVYHLGAVPAAGSSAREEWEARAGVVEAYLEQYGPSGPVDVADPIGRAPGMKSPSRYEDWKRANDVLGISRSAEFSARRATDAQLLDVIDRWERECQRAPEEVKARLDQAHSRVRQLEGQFERQRAKYPRSAGSPEMERLAESIREAQAAAEALEEAHGQRRDWYEMAAPVRLDAADARQELARRHPDQPVRVKKVREEMTVDEALRHDRQVLRAEQRQQAQSQKTRQEGLGLSLGRGL